MRTTVFADGAPQSDKACRRASFAKAIMRDMGLGERQIHVVASTATPDRVKDIMVPSGCQLDNYQNNPIVLANHDPSSPIGNADVQVKNGRVEATITFAPLGASAKADEFCALAKAGVINTVSVGFNPLESKPIKGGGWQIETWDLMEISLVSVPANPEAIVLARSLETAMDKADTASKWKVGASRNLPLDESSAWDGAAAKASIFAKAGFDGDSPDTAFARKGFLVYDSANPTLKGSYKLPFAKVVDGRLTAVASGVRAAASRLPQTDIPSEAKTKARAVLDDYESKMSDKGSPPMRIKDLSDVAELAYVLQRLGYLEDMAEWEAEREGDNSPVPQMINDAMRALGDALLAMTAEEIAELIGEETDAGEADVMEKSTSALVKAIGEIQAKAGRVFSAENQQKMETACFHIKSAHDIMTAMTAPPKAKATPGSGKPDPDANPIPEKSAPDTGKAAPTLTQRERELAILKLKIA